jgi:protein-S-isoprenylcysteine O-methyltransferase Ste14
MNMKNLRNMLTNEKRNEVAALLTVLFCLGYAALLTSEMARTVVEYTLVGVLCLLVVWFVYSLMKAVLEQLGKR